MALIVGNYKQRAAFLRSLFPNAKVDFNSLATTFFSSDPNMMAKKAELLDSLPNKKLTKTDIDLLNKKSSFGYTGFKALLMSKLKSNTRSAAEEEETDPSETVFNDMVNATCRELDISKENLDIYYFKDQKFKYDCAREVKSEIEECNLNRESEQTIRYRRR